MQHERFKQLAGQYLQRTREELVLLRVQLPRAREGDASALLEIQRIAHRINGSGAMLGFSAISQHAEKVERMVRQSDTQLGEADWQVILAQLQAIDDAVSQPRDS